MKIIFKDKTKEIIGKIMKHTLKKQGIKVSYDRERNEIYVKGASEAELDKFESELFNKKE